MISLLIYVLIVILIAGLVVYVIRMLAIPEPFKTAAILIILLVFLLVLLGIIGVIPGYHVGTLA